MKKETILISIIFFALILSIASAETLTIKPNGKGYYSSWLAKGCRSGSLEWQCVSENSAKTTDNLYAISKNVYESFTFEDINLINKTINSITLYYYGQRYSTTKYKFQPLIRAKPSNSKKAIDYFSSVKSLTSDYAYYSETYTNNPSTGKPWSISEINSLEAGMKTYTSNYGGRIAQVYAVVDYSTLNPDSCSDTDNGNKIKVFGSISGYFNNLFYSGTDSCVDSQNILEYFCNGAYKLSQQQSCGTDSYTGENYCMNNNVYRDYYDYYCKDGTCSSIKKILLQQSCTPNQQCINNQCVNSFQCIDTDTGYKPSIFGNLTIYTNQTSYTYADYCINNLTIVEFYCAGISYLNSSFNCLNNETSYCSEGRCI